MVATAEKYKFDCTIIVETEKAILVNTHPESGDKEFETWFPLSQVHEIHRTGSIESGSYDSLVVSQWIAQKKALI